MADRIKKSCDGCRALEYICGTFTTRYSCNLNYHQEYGIPKEPCPKPKTIRKFIDLTTNTK